MNAQKTTKFQKGQSGNPSGRPRSESVELRRKLSEHGEAMIEKMVELAKAGDVQALRFCLERLVPPLKASTLPVALPSGINPEQGMAAMSRSIVNAAASGEISAEDAEALLIVVSNGTTAIAKGRMDDNVEKSLALREGRKHLSFLERCSLELEDM
jgi:hypothetical protein